LQHQKVNKNSGAGIKDHQLAGWVLLSFKIQSIKLTTIAQTDDRRLSSPKGEWIAVVVKQNPLMSVAVLARCIYMLETTC
jgi:hypothetical protein